MAKTNKEIRKRVNAAIRESISLLGRGKEKGRLHPNSLGEAIEGLRYQMDSVVTNPNLDEKTRKVLSTRIYDVANQLFEYVPREKYASVARSISCQGLNDATYLEVSGTSPEYDRAARHLSVIRRDKAEMGVKCRDHHNRLGAVSAVIAGIAFIGAIFFSSPALTGNIVGSLSHSSLNFLRIFLFFIGLLFSFLAIRKK